MTIQFPSDWTVTRLSDIAAIQTGLALGKSTVEDPVTMPYLRVANVQDGHLDLRLVKTVVVSRKDIGRYSLRAGDVLVTEGGDFDKLGRGHLWRGEVDPCLHQNHIFAVRAKRDIVDPQYLAFFLSGRSARRYFLSASKRSTNLASINSTELRALPVAFPTIGEQEYIARTLSLWETAEQIVERLLSHYKELRRGLLHRLMTGQIGQGEIASIEWESFYLGDLFTERQESGRDDLPLLSITSERGVVPRSDVTRKDSSSADKGSYKRIAQGDIGYNTMRMWQGVSALSSLEGIVSPAYTVCVPNSKIDGNFAAHLFKYPPMVHRFYRFSQGLVDDTLNLKFPQFSRIRVELPPIGQQRWTAKAMSSLDTHIRLLSEYKSSIRKQKKCLTDGFMTRRMSLQELVHD